MEEKSKRGFYHFAESWYYRNCLATRRVGAPIDEVSFGLYYRDYQGEGTAAELCMEWAEKPNPGDPLIAQIVVMDDAFELLRDFADVWQELASMQPSGERKVIAITPEEFCELLKKCGFVDLTEREQQAIDETDEDVNLIESLRDDRRLSRID